MLSCIGLGSPRESKLDERLDTVCIITSNHLFCTHESCKHSRIRSYVLLGFFFAQTFRI